MRLIRLPPVVCHSLPGSWTDSRRSASSVVRPYRPLKTEPLASRRMSQARSASHSRAARSTTVLRTGGRSNVEPLMIFRTSLMAVCCSSASRVSSKRRTFSIAIAAWPANVCTSSISRSLNGRTSYRDRTTAPIPRPSLSIGTPRTVFDFVSFATRELRSRSSWLTSGTWTVRASPSVTPMTPPSGPIGRQSPWAWPCARCRANSARTAAGNSLLYARVLNCPPSARDNQPMSAPARRIAFSSTTSSTGWRSKAERLMVLSTSPTAVCRSRASFVSLKRRTFSIAITACAANVCTRSTSADVNGRTSGRRRKMQPIARPSRSSGVARIVRWPASRAMRALCGYSSSAAWRSSTWIVRASRTARALTVSRSIAHSCIGSAEARGVRGDRVEHRLQVRRRAGDRLEHLSRRGLALERLLRLVEETDVVERDDRLCRERLDELDLPRTEGARKSAPQLDRADRTAVLEKGRREEATVAVLSGVFLPLAELIVRQGLHVRHVEEPRLLDRTWRDGPVRQLKQVRRLRDPRLCVGQHDAPVLTHDRHGRVVGVAESRGALGDGVQHGLDIRRRARDHAKDLGDGGLTLERPLRFVEETDVLDRDRCLIGEARHELDLLRRERADLVAAQRHHPDRLAVAQDRYAEQRTEAELRLELDECRIDPGFRECIFDLCRDAG